MNFNRCWVKHDAGKDVRQQRQDKARDCTVRALATACALSYRDAWQLLYDVQGEQGRAGFELSEWLVAVPARFGVVEALSFPAVSGRARMNGARFCAAYPSGRFMLHMAHHVVAVVDGQLFDTWNSSSRCVYAAWRVTPVVRSDRGEGKS